MPIIVDAHQDLAYNALTFGRDYRRSVADTRAGEVGSEAVARNGNTLIGLPELLAGQVAVVFGTLFASPKRRKQGDWDSQAYADAQQAHMLYAKQVDYYNQLCDEEPRFTRVRTRGELEKILADWDGADETQRRIGLVTLMEGADGVREPEELEQWMERGVRLVGPAWAGTRYSGGTGDPGPLPPDGRRLLDVMADLGLILDVSHASDESCLSMLDRYRGVVVATHANPRALVRNPTRPERFLTDEMIRLLAERGGVIGIVPFNRFLTGDWKNADGKNAVTLEHVLAMMDHICQVTGSAAHVAIGSDFDGGFGLEAVPAEIDTVADLQKLAPALRARGYSEKDVAGILGQNWIEVLRRGLPA